MNLFDMARRGDRNLILSEGVDHAKFQVNGAYWRGLRMLPGSSFRIPDIRRFASFRSFSDQTGWIVQGPEMISLRLALLDGNDGSVLGVHRFQGDRQPVMLPWPRHARPVIDLVVQAEGEGNLPIFVGGHRILSRQWLLDQAVGKGLELGPGPNPQVRPGPNVDVAYLEQMLPEQWNELYNRSGKFPVRPELWNNYVTGEARDLPAADGSLDFIFASHVFEHLANPIGHLARWHAKLSEAGRIICIVPDFHGTKDSEQYPSTMAEWLAEREADIWAPGRAHYQRCFGGHINSKNLEKQIAANASIHVHFYDNVNCQLLLNYAVSELDYKDFVIEHTANHKDFYFVLYR